MIAFQFLCFWYFGNPTAGIKNAKFNLTLKESCPREQLFLVYYSKKDFLQSRRMY